MTEETLSDKRVNRSPELWPIGYIIYHTAIMEEDVKDFIKKLKEDIRTNANWEMCWEECIDKLAGKELI